MPIQQYPDCNIAPGGVIATPHRYWRFLFQESNDPQYITFAEVKLRATPGVDAPMTGFTYTASSVFDGTGTYAAPKAADGDPNTAWVNAIGQIVNGWWKIDFGGSPRAVAQYTVQAFPSALGAGQAPKAWKLQWSDDDIGWTDANVVTGATGWTASQIRTYDV